MNDDQHARPWWQTATIYQVYVRSFQDSDDDGVGDLRGLISRLDYLAWLGVDALWLSPIYPSPMIDGGYDIADFCDVDPAFGDLATFDRLIAEAHARGLRLIVDFVPNHTSDRHPWFKASRASRENPKRDWYVWRDGVDGGPPNNWSSMLGGPAWTRDAATGQFYYHAFLPEQPDLDWRHPAVRDAMADVLRFWLAQRVDGVRVDAVPHLVEDALLRDDVPGEVALDDVPVSSGMRHVFSADRPETRDHLLELRRTLDAFLDRVLIAEVHLPVAQMMAYYGAGAHLPFNFALISTPWDVRALAAAIDHYSNLLPPGAWPNWLLGNHDETRVASRVGAAQARVAAVLQFTLGGTVFVYNGEELGLEDVRLDAEDVARIPEARHPDHAAKTAPRRTPMPWDGGPKGGFTSGEPWLPLGRANSERDVAGQTADGRSTLALYRRLIALRRSEPALVGGRTHPEAAQGDVLIFRREAGDARLLVALNIGAQAGEVTLSGTGTIVLSTHLDREGERCAGKVALRGDEGVVITL
ncbi:MAG: DUF3459 domain-containing protein [Parafilimonas terrae]|nr:DUF3459 domain-containing protein [Parafilimonas terrae]